MKAIVKARYQQNNLAPNFLNVNGDNVSSVRFGHWLTKLNSMLFADTPAGQRKISKMLANKMYAGNGVLSSFNKNGEVEWFVHNGISNVPLSRGVEYSGMSKDDFVLTQLSYYATTASPDFYYQNYGIVGDRDHVLFFRVPRYGNMSELSQAYDRQATIESNAVRQRLQGLTGDALQNEINKIRTNFSRISLNRIEIDDTGKFKIHNGMKYQSEHQSKIDELKSIVERYDLTGAMSRDLVGPGEIHYSIRTYQILPNELLD